jgi:hypothetical protein
LRHRGPRLAEFRDDAKRLPWSIAQILHNLLTGLLHAAAFRAPFAKSAAMNFSILSLMAR